MAITRSQMPKELKPGLGRNWKRDPYAKILESRLYGQKVVQSKKLYNRKRSKQPVDVFSPEIVDASAKKGKHIRAYDSGGEIVIGKNVDKDLL